MSKDRYERQHRRTARHSECVEMMAKANFDRMPLAEALGLPGPRTYCEFCPGVDGAGCCVCGNDLPSLTAAV